MRKPLLTVLLLIVLTRLGAAQDFPWGQVGESELNMKSYAKDPAAHAVVLNEFGKATIALITGDKIRLVYEYHVRIKIFDSKGFGYGTVQVPVYHNSNNVGSYEEIQDITGDTYYLDDKGVPQKTKLETAQIYPVDENKHWANYKFEMPGMRNGCVVEYKYKTVSPYFYNFYPWHFQDYIPKVYSEYEAHIPAFWHYNISLKGYLKLTKNTSAVEPDCLLTVNGDATTKRGADCSVLVYGMADIPAFTAEEYLTSPRNFMSAINFVETSYSDPYDDTNETKLSRNWKDVDYTLKQDIYFGQQLKKASLFGDRIVPVIAGQTGDLGKAKAIYAYIQQSFKWDGHYDFEANTTVNNALNKHGGNSGDINLCLINALAAAGLNVKAVILSTRNHGTINTLYPDINDFNYIIAQADIDGQTYSLDATDPELSFGLLPLRCLNGKGRAFNNNTSDWVDINPLQKQKSTRTLDFTVGADGKLKGTYICYYTSYDAYEKRSAIKKFNTTNEYIEDLANKSPRIKVLKSEVTNLDSLDNPLIEKYELEIDPIDPNNNSDLAFNPFFWNRIDVTPFSLADRLYPVDLGMPSDERLTLTLHLPSQYSVASPPQPMGVGIPGNGGKFVTNYQGGDHTFTFSCAIQLNNPRYDAAEYPALKEFYNKIVQSEKAEIILKKN